MNVTDSKLKRQCFIKTKKWKVASKQKSIMYIVTEKMKINKWYVVIRTNVIKKFF